MRYLFLVLCICLFSLQSCEDKKSRNANTTANEEIHTGNETENSSVEEKGFEQPETEQQKEEKTEKLKMIDTIEPPLLVQEELIPFLTRYGQENPENKVRISTKFGDIDVELFRDTPLHTANFILLVKNGYFNETYFHRVAEGFVIQGGNSDNASTNRKRYKFGSYLIPNEYTSRHTHVHGAFSAAKYSEQNVSNASSPFEFFIVQSKNGAHHLDGEHTVFGQVIRGMDVVDEISKVETDEGEWPIRNIPMEINILD